METASKFANALVYTKTETTIIRYYGKETYILSMPTKLFYLIKLAVLHKFIANIILFSMIFDQRC